MIHTGWNILRFVKAEKNENAKIGGIPCTTYLFRAVNLNHEEIAFHFAVTVGSKRGQIIRDLEFMTATKRWTDVNLVEKEGTMMILNMRIPAMNQEEIKFIK